jgi:hypothetical protein
LLASRKIPGKSHDEHVENFVEAFQLQVRAEGSQEDTHVVFRAALYAFGAKTAKVVPVHVASVLTPRTAPTVLSAHQAAFLFVLPANL